MRFYDPAFSNPDQSYERLVREFLGSRFSNLITFGSEWFLEYQDTIVLLHQIAVSDDIYALKHHVIKPMPSNSSYPNKMSIWLQDKLLMVFDEASRINTIVVYSLKERTTKDEFVNVNGAAIDFEEIIIRAKSMSPAELSELGKTLYTKLLLQAI